MRRALAIVFLSIGLCNGLTWADDAAPAAPQGNQGYVYGTAPKSTDDSSSASSGTDNSSAPSSIPDAIGKIDAWIRKNLW